MISAEVPEHLPRKVTRKTDLECTLIANSPTTFALKNTAGSYSTLKTLRFSQRVVQCVAQVRLHVTAKALRHLHRAGVCRRCSTGNGMVIVNARTGRSMRNEHN